MNSLRVYRIIYITKLKFPYFHPPRNYSQSVLLDQDEYTETPQYPPILDLSLRARKICHREMISEKIRKLHTIEEKQIALNMPRYYGWKCVMLEDEHSPFNALPLVQCYTRTHFTSTDKLPNIYLETEPQAALVVQEIKSLIEDSISLEHLGLNKSQEKQYEGQPHLIENELSNRIVRQINRVIINNLADKAQHILSAQVDYDPRLEGFWFVGGVNPPKSVVKFRKQYGALKDRVYEPIDRPVQYLGTPILAIRNSVPLRPLLPYSEAENPSFAVPKYTYHPETTGYFTAHRHGTNIPGFWPGDPDEFGLLSIHRRGYILKRKPSFGEIDNVEALHCQAIKASFGWLLAQANYQGFTTFNDLTYPLVTQTLITNGQLWSIYAYQLNTVLMHSEHIDTNPKYNVCFGTNPLKLYESIDENGRVVGFNDDVLKMIVQIYLNAPEERDYEMKPYLGEDEQVIADIEDDNRRCWLEERYKHLVSNRPRHYLLPETYHWEDIYKIKYNTRFMEARRRPFELGIRPFTRRLDDHLSRYIPKVLREYPKSKKKWEKTYYPDV